MHECHYIKCGKVFATTKDLRRHWVVHTGLKEFQCSYCHLFFGRKDHKLRHENNAHSKNSAKKSIARIQHQASHKMLNQKCQCPTNVQIHTCTHPNDGGSSSVADESRKDIKQKGINMVDQECLQQNNPDPISFLSSLPSLIPLPTYDGMSLKCL